MILPFTAIDIVGEVFLRDPSHSLLGWGFFPGKLGCPRLRIFLDSQNSDRVVDCVYIHAGYENYCGSRSSNVVYLG